MFNHYQSGPMTNNIEGVIHTPEITWIRALTLVADKGRTQDAYFGGAYPSGEDIVNKIPLKRQKERFNNYHILLCICWPFNSFDLLLWHINYCRVFNAKSLYKCILNIWFLNTFHRLSYLPTPPLGQDMTQGQFLSWV